MLQKTARTNKKELPCGYLQDAGEVSAIALCNKLATIFLVHLTNRFDEACSTNEHVRIFSYFIILFNCLR